MTIYQKSQSGLSSSEGGLAVLARTLETGEGSSVFVCITTCTL
jgi:hypothetical protein